MNYRLLSLKEQGLLSLLLAVSVFLCLAALFKKSSWEYIFGDLNPQSTVVIPHVHVVAEYPLTERTIKKILNNQAKESIPSFPVRIPRFDKMGNTHGLSFSEQVINGFIQRGFSKNQLIGKDRYAFYVDIAKKDISHVSAPYLYYSYSRDTPVKVYVNGLLRLEASHKKDDLGFVALINETKEDYFRVVWIAQKREPDLFVGLAYHYPLSVQSASSIDQLLRFYGLRENFVSVVGAIIFLIIGIIALSFAFATKNFVDIWAFSAFSTAMGFYIWTKVEVFYASWAWEDGGILLSKITIVLQAAVVLFSVILTLSYFRLKGREIRFHDLILFLRKAQFKEYKTIMSQLLETPFFVIILSSLLACSSVVYDYWPRDVDHLWLNSSIVGTKLSYICLLAQLSAFVVGYYNMFKHRKIFLHKKLWAQVRIMNKRIISSLFYTVSMCIMMVVFVNGLSGLFYFDSNQNVLLAALLPAISMLLMFFWMMTSSNRFYQKFTPRLNQIDHELFAFEKKALERRYYGSLVVFDLKGMKELTLLAQAQLHHGAIIDQFLLMIEQDLSVLIEQPQRVTFKYKSNGDEFIFNMYATDSLHARTQLSDIFYTWHHQCDQLLNKWRNYLFEQLKNEIPNDQLNQLISLFEIHVLMVSLHDMKITVKGSYDKPTGHPDFIDPRFTCLTQLFKGAYSHKIAMYQDDAEFILTRMQEHGVHHLKFHQGDVEQGGYLVWPPLDPAIATEQAS